MARQQCGVSMRCSYYTTYTSRGGLTKECIQMSMDPCSQLDHLVIMYQQQVRND